MKRTLIGTWTYVLCLAALAAAFIFPQTVQAQGLQVAYGSKGVQTISFNGVQLVNVGTYPADVFHIWHMKATDLNGNTLSQDGWGESNNGENWNPRTNTEIYTFAWGSVSTQFVQSGNNLNMIVTETNNAGSGIIFDGAEIYPFALHFPQDPAGFSGYNQFAITTTGPAVVPADYGSGVVTTVIPNESVSLYGGWKSEGTNTYTPIMTGTAPDGLATFLPSNDQPVAQGSSLTYTVSLRFTPEGTSADASDAYSSFAATYPSQMTWTDKRIIGTAYLASSPSNSDITQPGGFPTNPRRYFNDPTVNITTAAGLQAFQDRMLTQATTNVNTARSLGSQGVVTWDIEGEQYPQSTSYVCSPDQIATVAPEMESTITDSSTGYYGQKLDDAYFKTMSSAGLKIGVCLRPQVFTFGANGTASQVYLTTNASMIANLETKAKYANARWGATMFYVDSTVNTSGGVLDPAIFQQLITDLPTFLFIPEESTPRYYAYTAPFYSFIFQTDLGTPSSTYHFYPKAFGANLINDVSASTLATYTPQLTQSVANGDILMGHADYWQANDPTLVSIYQAAGITAPAPVQVTPVLSWTAPAGITYGTALSSTQLDATASVPGTFVYTPSAGTVLSSGLETLLVSFTPTDTTDYKSTTASTTLAVAQAVPAISWSAPAAIIAGTALSATQLNAKSSVAGTFTYSPGSGTVPAVGTDTLQVSFTPADTGDYTTASASTSLVVTAKAQTTPTITWATPASIAYGTQLSTAQLDATASVAGSFTYNPTAGTVLKAGLNTLQMTFTPSDTADYTSAATTITLTVTRSVPTVTWSKPASIVSGTALSSTQLNATASVPGAFAYGPAAGTVPALGTDTLLVTFTPADTLDYTTVSASTSVVVTAKPQSTPKISWATPVSIVYGTPLSVAQLNATASVAGSFSYSPAAGTVLSAGSNSLQVTFTPADTADYTSASSTVNLTVTQAVPVLTWATPSAISSGTALSAVQLNATANVPGSFVYSPAAGSIPAAGSSILQVTFTPANTTNYTTQTASVVLNVNAAAPPNVSLAVLAPSAGQTVSGTIQVTGYVTLFLDSAGTFLMVDGQEVGTRRVQGAPFVYPLDTTTLTNGVHILQLWAHDIGNNTTISAGVPINVAN